MVKAKILKNSRNTTVTFTELPHTGFNLSFHVLVYTQLKILLKFYDQLF